MKSTSPSLYGIWVRFLGSLLSWAWHERSLGLQQKLEASWISSRTKKPGILVKPDNPGALANAVLALLRDPELQRFLGENGYASVQERFLWKHAGLAYEEVYKKLVGKV